MTTTKKDRWRLAFTGFLQVIFVSMNTIFITQKFWIALLLTSFAISFIWTGNVKKVVFGDMKDRLVYSCGATVGCGLGVAMASALI